MKDYSSAYKAYDIRSIWNEPVDGTFCYSLGKGIGAYLLKTVGKDASFVFGADVREANNELIYRFLKGLEEGGCTNYVGIGIPVEAVDDEQQQLRGVASTMMLYYCTQHTFDMGAMFTASHNPPEYVGMKIVDREASLTPSDTLAALVEVYESVDEEIDEEDFQRIWTKAMGDENTLYPLIEEKIQSLAGVYAETFAASEKTYKIVVDFSNGAGVAYERMFLDEIVAPLGHELIYLNEGADSDFSAHLSDTTDVHDYEQLMHKVQQEGADFGMMFDGDADRIGCVDEQGKYVGGDLLVAAISAAVLAQHPEGQSIVYDVTSTNAIPEIVASQGGRAIPSRVGHRYIKELFKQHDAVFAGELSGHLFFPEVGGFESPLIALSYIFQSLGQYASFSAMIATLSPYYKPPLVNYTVTDKEAVLTRIKEQYKDADLDLTDGVRVNFADWRFLVRPSNTEPKLRCYIETKDKQQWEEKVKEVEVLILG